MTVGHYDAGTGELELQPVSGAPKVFVIAGGGRGADASLISVSKSDSSLYESL